MTMLKDQFLTLLESMLKIYRSFFYIASIVYIELNDIIIDFIYCKASRFSGNMNSNEPERYFDTSGGLTIDHNKEVNWHGGSNHYFHFHQFCSSLQHYVVSRITLYNVARLILMSPIDFWRNSTTF